MKRAVLAVPCVLALTCASWGANGKASADWQNVSTLQPGEKIQVVDSAGRKHSGRFTSVTSTAIILHENAGDETIPRENVVRVSGGGHRARNALIGAAIGAGAGAAVGAAGTTGGCTSNCIGKVTRGDVIAVTTGFGAIVGALVGAILHANRTIYRAP